jgi:hypothetical protein
MGYYLSMNKAVFFFTILFFFVSCTREKQPGIVGSWTETATYRQSVPGQFNWEYGARWATCITFTSDGHYSAFNDVPAGHGSYQFNAATRELKINHANTGGISTCIVSRLDDEYMDIDYLNNGVLELRNRYKRNQ